MNKVFVFFCCSCVILLFSIINLCIGPIINRRVNYTNISIPGASTSGSSWGILNCAYLSDQYDKDKKDGPIDDKDKKYKYEWKINECQRKKGMHDMEYTTFIFDIVIGFVCGLLGLLHYFELKPDFISKTGLIGLICGAIGFIFSFVYVILNGIVFTNYYDDPFVKRDGDGAFAEKTGTPGKYKCLYFDEKGNIYSLIAKYSDLINKQYTYEKDRYKSIDDSCIDSLSTYTSDCYNSDDGIINGPTANCEYLYAPEINDNEYKDTGDRFLTTLLLSLFVCLASIGLAIFGFLLFKNPGAASTATEVNVQNQNPTSKFTVDQKLNS